MNLLNDPMAAAFIPLVLLLLFGWGMSYALGRDERADWWVSLLQTLRIVPREQEPETPVATKMNVLYIGPDRDAMAGAQPEPVDYRPLVARSRTVFTVLGVVMLLLTSVHAFRFYRRADPYFLWGPTPAKFARPDQRGDLPAPVPGAGGAGATPFIRPEGQNPSPGTGPGMVPPGRPGAQPGGGMPGAP